jgi:hypothetical protein
MELLMDLYPKYEDTTLSQLSGTGWYRELTPKSYVPSKGKGLRLYLLLDLDY